MTVMLHDQSHDQSLDRPSISLLRSAEFDQVSTKRRAKRMILKHNDEGVWA